MIVYFYSDNGEQRGPVSYDELNQIGISKNTLVWRDGLDDWKEAGSIPELSGLFAETAKQVQSDYSSTIISSRDGEKAEDESLEIDNTKMFKHAFVFKGRARRSEFLIAYISFYAAMMIFYALAQTESGFASFVGIILFIGGSWFLLSEGTRRCHDLGHSGFWQLIPYYVFWMLFQNSKEGPNEYGNNPKGENFKKLY